MACVNEETAQNRRIATSFWLAVGVLAVVGMFKSLNDTLDPDCFWHLRVAEQLQRDGIGPIVDHLSFASIKQPWTPYSWLAELAMHGLWSVGGYRAAAVASALLCALFVAIVALLCIELAGARRRMNAIMM